MKILTLTVLVTAAVLQGCAYPEPAKVEQHDARPTLGVSGAPAGSLLFVDGLKIGSVKRFNGKAGVLLVESGKHKVEVRNTAGQTLFSEDVFLGSSTTKVLIYKP
jgi:hypothetical protein